MIKPTLLALLSLSVAACANTSHVIDQEPTSYIVGRKIISIYNPIPDGKYAQFYDWGREYARMYSQLGRCSNKNVLQGKFIERIKISSMAVGKDQYNQIMWAMRDQANQLAQHANQLNSELLHEYYSELSTQECSLLENTADYMVFDSLDYALKWRQSIGDDVTLEKWKVYPVFANQLGNVSFDDRGYVVRDTFGNIRFTNNLSD